MYVKPIAVDIFGKKKCTPHKLNPCLKYKTKTYIWRHPSDYEEAVLVSM